MSPRYSESDRALSTLLYALTSAVQVTTPTAQRHRGSGLWRTILVSFSTGFSASGSDGFARATLGCHATSASDIQIYLRGSALGHDVKELWVIGFSKTQAPSELPEKGEFAPLVWGVC